MYENSTVVWKRNFSNSFRTYVITRNLVTEITSFYLLHEKEKLYTKGTEFQKKYKVYGTVESRLTIYINRNYLLKNK